MDQDWRVVSYKIGKKCGLDYLDRKSIVTNFLIFRIIVVRNVVGWRSSILHVFFLLLCVFGYCGVYHFSSCFQWQKDVHKRMFLILNQRFVITRLFLGVNWRPKLPNAETSKRSHANALN